ncbi:MAG: hypothetical protein ABH950_06680, partial [Candidatus Altiarchaeota archaeon]
MGLFDFLFGSSKGAENQSRQKEGILLEFSDIPLWVNNEAGKEKKDLMDEGELISANIINSAEEVYSILKKLEKEPIPKTIHKKIYKILKTTKPEYVKSMFEALTPLVDFNLTDPDTLLSYHEQTSSALQKTAKLAFGPGRYIPAAFGEQSNQIQLRLKDAMDDSNKLAKLLKSNRKLTAETKIRKEVELVEGLINQLEKTRENEKNNHEKIKQNDKLIASVKKEIKSLDQSDEIRIQKKSEVELSELNEELDLLENEVMNLLNSIKRFVRKLEKSQESNPGLLAGVVNAQLNRKFLDSPVDLLTSPEGERIDEILTDYRSVLSGGKLSLSGKETKKILSKIDAASKSSLPGKRARILQLRVEIDELKEKIKGLRIKKKKDGLEEKIEEY